eukprot:9357947-Ditylum_brightwellii.AAC.1
MCAPSDSRILEHPYVFIIASYNKHPKLIEDHSEPSFELIRDIFEAILQEHFPCLLVLETAHTMKGMEWYNKLKHLHRQSPTKTLYIEECFGLKLDLMMEQTMTHQQFDLFAKYYKQFYMK